VTDEWVIRDSWKRKSRNEMKIRTALLPLFLFLSFVFFRAVPPAFSQGCAMCSSYVEASSKGGQRAVNKGVLLLLVPPASFMTLGLAAAYRYSRKRDLEQS